MPTVDALIDFIQDSGGVGGLYDLSRVPVSDGIVSPQPEKQNVVDLNHKPTDIDLPHLSARVTNSGRGYRLQLPEWQAGEYLVRLRIGRGGVVMALLDEDIKNDNAA